MEQHDFFPDSVAYQSLEEGFHSLIEWLDAHPDRDVREFAGWRDMPSSPPPPRDSTTPP